MSAELPTGTSTVESRASLATECAGTCVPVLILPAVISAQSASRRALGMVRVRARVRVRVRVRVRARARARVRVRVRVGVSPNPNPNPNQARLGHVTQIELGVGVAEAVGEVLALLAAVPGEGLG